MSTRRTLISRLIPLLLCLLLVGSCSMVRLGYSHLDSVAAWMAQDYFDLNTDQRDAFARRFQRLHAWHRHDQLPDYAQLLEDLQQRVRNGLRSDDMLWLIDGLKQRYARIAIHAASDAADLLATLSPEQITGFQQQLTKDNQKFLREHRSQNSEAERRKAAERRALAQLRDWTGPLSDAQETQIISMLQTLPLMDQLRHEDRLRRQRELITLLELRSGDRKVFTQRLRDWLTQWEHGRSARHAQLFEESWRKRAAFYADVSRMLTAEQRDHLLHRLQDYSSDFRRLAERSPAGMPSR